MQAQLEQLLGELAAEDFGPGSTAIDWVLVRISDGRSVSSIRDEIVATGRLPFDNFSRGWLSQIINGLTPDAKTRIVDARKESAHILIDEATEIVDSTKDERNREAIASAKLRSDNRLWRAQRYNKDEFGERGPQIQVNIGALHLDALRRRSVTAKAESVPLPAPTVVDAEFEIIQAVPEKAA